MRSGLLRAAPTRERHVAPQFMVPNSFRCPTVMLDVAVSNKPVTPETSLERLLTLQQTQKYSRYGEYSDVQKFVCVPGNNTLPSVVYSNTLALWVMDAMVHHGQGVSQSPLWEIPVRRDYLRWAVWLWKLWVWPLRRPGSYTRVSQFSTPSTLKVYVAAVSAYHTDLKGCFRGLHSSHYARQAAGSQGC